MVFERGLPSQVKGARLKIGDSWAEMRNLVA